MRPASVVTMNRSIQILLRQHGRSLTWLMALGASGLVLAAVVLTRLLALHPCPLCIFQRVLDCAIALVLLVAYWGWWRRALRAVALSLGMVLALVGVVVAGQQSWLQWFQAEYFVCRSNELGMVEQLVEWLGQQAPILFLATGSCESKGLVILGLSLANWSFLAYVVLFAGSAVLLFQSGNTRQSS